MLKKHQLEVDQNSILNFITTTIKQHTDVDDDNDDDDGGGGGYWRKRKFQHQFPSLLHSIA